VQPGEARPDGVVRDLGGEPQGLGVDEGLVEREVGSSEHRACVMDSARKIARATAVGSSRGSGMATRESLPELNAEGLELERRAAEGQPGPVGARQAFGQIGGINRHA
jgi:hypothetical protein